MLRPCNIENCPACTFGCFCERRQVRCAEVKSCLIKEVIEKPYNRMRYVNNKLSSCMGYSEEEKRIRYEELDWVLNEIIKLLGVKHDNM